ncbi:MAG: HAD hydrolase-like protein [Melioribacteraceae bacterium]|nr:HAD hydrolase-like protein [Melioribacteraceae bacterium]
MKLLDKYKYVIWDWNGTIFNDVELCVDVGNNLFKKKNKNTISVEKYRSIFTIPVKDYYIAAGFDFSVESFEDIGKEWMDEYEERKFECSLYEHLTSVMEIFKVNGIDQSVVSAYKQDRLIELIEEFGLSEYLDHIVGLDNIYAAGKVHLAKNLINTLGNGEDRKLMIGDTVHDFEVAEEVGADCILIASGHQSKEKLIGTGVKVYDSMKHFSDMELSVTE